MTTCTSTEHGYRVQARDTLFHHFNPVMLHDGILGPDWREVRFELGRNPAGIPVRGFGQKHEHELLTYEGAMALAWTLIAQHDLHQIQCRLVRYKLETSFALKPEGEVEMQPITSALFRDIPLSPTARMEPDPQTEKEA